MGSGLKSNAKKKNHKGLCSIDYAPNEDEKKWYKYCVDNDIRISTKPTQQGMYPEEWRIEIAIGPYKRGEKTYLSPNVYTIDNVYQALYNTMKYYYDKRTG